MNTLHRVALKHHYGWEIYEVAAASLPEAAYKAVRGSHAFLTDENHTHTEGPSSFTWGGKIIDYEVVTVRKNVNSPRFALAPAWVADGPGELWLGVEYRAAAPGEENPAWIESLRRRREAVKVAA